MIKNIKNKNYRGITLVALVVTIVVLLILAGITITMLVGDNGIISQAKKAQNLTEQDEANTQKGLQDLINEINKYYSDNPGEETVDFATILADLEANPSNYLAQAQALGQTTDTDIGIGTDGKVVNLDLWVNRVKTDDGAGISLGNCEESFGNNKKGYQLENIIDGKIQGTVPQYIYITSEKAIYPVTAMTGTFNYNADYPNRATLKYAPKLPTTLQEMNSTFFQCEGLLEAPIIPSSVTNMRSTFYECNSLTTAPTIPSSVTNMQNTFSSCTSLTTAPTIPSSVTNMEQTFRDCTALTTVPTIPSSVTNMDSTFSGCTKLQGDLVINANPTSYEYCLYNAGKDASSKLYLSGSSTKLNELLNTKGNSTNIEIK